MLQSLCTPRIIGGDSCANPHVDGGTSRFDKRGIVYQAVAPVAATACDLSRLIILRPMFPAVNVPALHQKNRASSAIIFVFKFDLSQLKARHRLTSVKLDMPGLNR